MTEVLRDSDSALLMSISFVEVHDSGNLYGMSGLERREVSEHL